MNSTVYISTDAELENISDCTTGFDIYEGAGDNATAPMAVVLPPCERWDEEELHTSFEQAISGRVTAMQERLSRLSSGQLLSQRVLRNTDPLLTPGRVRAGRARSKRARKNWQRYIIFVGFALMCMLIGFDVMGLLVLHMVR